MKISKPDIDSKVKRDNAKPSRPAFRAIGCRRLFKAACIALGLICGIPLVLTSPELHRHIDSYVQPPIITPAPASKESDMIAFTCAKYGEYPRNRLFILYSDGSGLRQLNEHHFKRYGHISWSPDGTWFVLGAKNIAFNLWGTANNEIYRVRFDGLEVRRLTYDHYHAFFPHWSDDDGSISFVSFKDISFRGIHQISVNGDEISRTDNTHIGPRFWAHPFAWSSDNQKYAFSPYFFVAYGSNPDGSDLQELEEMKDGIQGIEWSPNNEQILYYDSYDKLVVYNVKTRKEDFSLNMDVTLDARWSPDGNWIAIVGQTENAGSGIYLYLLDVQTSDIQTVTIDDIRIRRSISWSPDSEWIAFSDYDYLFGDEDKYIGQMFKIRRDGRDLQQLAKLDCRIGELSWSPT